MHKQASCIMHVSLGPFLGQGEQQGGGRGRGHLQGPALTSAVCINGMQHEGCGHDLANEMQELLWRGQIRHTLVRQLHIRFQLLNLLITWSYLHSSSVPNIMPNYLSHHATNFLRPLRPMHTQLVHARCSQDAASRPRCLPKSKASHDMRGVPSHGTMIGGLYRLTWSVTNNTGVHRPAAAD